MVGLEIVFGLAVVHVVAPRRVSVRGVPVVVEVVCVVGSVLCVCLLLLGRCCVCLLLWLLWLSWWLLKALCPSYDLGGVALYNGLYCLPDVCCSYAAVVFGMFSGKGSDKGEGFFPCASKVFHDEWGDVVCGVSSVFSAFGLSGREAVNLGSAF